MPVRGITPSDIVLFIGSSKGGGRGANDASNKVREYILTLLGTPRIKQFCDDPTYGSSWSQLNDKWIAFLMSHCGVKNLETYSIAQKGGRRFNYDFDVWNGGDAPPVKLEFKYGCDSIMKLPQYLSVYTNKPFIPTVSYVDYFYDNYLDRIAGVCGLSRTDIPDKSQYTKHVYSSDSAKKHPFFRAIHKPERDPLYSAKAELVHESIRTYLAAHGRELDLGALTVEFQRSQGGGKQYALYAGGEFHGDSIVADELVATNIHAITHNTIIVQSACATTRHELLLRWKNGMGVTGPAWQISMRRGAAAAEDVLL